MPNKKAHLYPILTYFSDNVIIQTKHDSEIKCKFINSGHQYFPQLSVLDTAFAVTVA